MSSDTVPGEEDLTAPVDSPKPVGPTPPYIALPTFFSMLDRLRESGVPQVFDGSFFGNTSGSTIALHRATFKAFGLMNDDKTPTPLMRELSAADDDRRREILTEIGRGMYAECIQLGEEGGTTGQLADIFRAKGITGATVQKAIGFYLSFADYAGYPISPFFKKGRAASAGSGNNGSAPRRTRKRAAAKSTTPVVAPMTHHPTTTGRSVEEEQKVKYIDLLMKLAAPAEEGGQVNSDILDRIERMLNVDVPNASTAVNTAREAE